MFKRLIISNSVKDQLNKAYWNYVNDLTASLKTNPQNSGLLSKHAQVIVAWQAASSTREKEQIHHSIKLTFSTVSYSLFSSRTQKQVISRSPSQLTEHVIGRLSCSVEEVAKLLQSIDVNKASGSDNIPPRILKECAMELALPLTNFFNFTLSRGNIPNDWKAANVCQYSNLAKITWQITTVQFH